MWQILPIQSFILICMISNQFYTYCFDINQSWLDYCIINFKSLPYILYDINQELTKLLYNQPKLLARHFASSQSWQILPVQSFIFICIISNQGWLNCCIINPKSFLDILYHPRVDRFCQYKVVYLFVWYLPRVD